MSMGIARVKAPGLERVEAQPARHRTGQPCGLSARAANPVLTRLDAASATRAAPSRPSGSSAPLRGAWGVAALRSAAGASPPRRLTAAGAAWSAVATPRLPAPPDRTLAGLGRRKVRGGACTACPTSTASPRRRSLTFAGPDRINVRRNEQSALIEQHPSPIAANRGPTHRAEHRLGDSRPPTPWR